MLQLQSVNVFFGLCNLSTGVKQKLEFNIFTKTEAGSRVKFFRV